MALPSHKRLLMAPGLAARPPAIAVGGAALLKKTHRSRLVQPANVAALDRPSAAFQGANADEQHKVAIFVEPSPFSHISGMKNRFESLIRGLRDAGDDVLVFTPDRNPPDEFCGAKVWLLWVVDRAAGSVRVLGPAAVTASAASGEKSGGDLTARQTKKQLAQAPSPFL